MTWPTGAEIQRDTLPQLVGENTKFNQAFFADIRQALDGIGISRIFGNSGAKIRQAIGRVMMGERGYVHVVAGGDELTWEQYTSEVGHQSDADLVRYPIWTAISKFFREYDESQENECVLAIDTINFVRVDGRWQKQEKPSELNLDEAITQMRLLLTQGTEFMIANGTVFGPVKAGAFGASLWVMPARFNIPDEHREKVVAQAIKKLEDIYATCNTGELRPGGLSSLDPLLVPYLEVGVMNNEDDHEVLRERELVDLTSTMNKVKRWLSFGDPELNVAYKVGLGATGIGASPYGIRTAVQRFLECRGDESMAAAADRVRMRVLRTLSTTRA